MADKRKENGWGVYIVLGLFLLFIVFLKPETVFEQQYTGAGKPYSVTVKTYGTGFFNREISFIHYKIDGKTVETENFTFFSPFTDNIYVSWLVEPSEGTWWIDNVVNIRMDYWVSRGLHDGEMKTYLLGLILILSKNDEVSFRKRHK